jgi:Mg2+-importing ATPase
VKLKFTIFFFVKISYQQAPSCCQFKVNLILSQMVLSAGVEMLSAEKDDLTALIERCTVFAKVTPQQKMAIVAALQRNDHIVGFLGDGTNDALALRKADVGISVDSGAH